MLSSTTIFRMSAEHASGAKQTTRMAPSLASEFIRIKYSFKVVKAACCLRLKQYRVSARSRLHWRDRAPAHGLRSVPLLPSYFPAGPDGPKPDRLRLKASGSARPAP